MFVQKASFFASKCQKRQNGPCGERLIIFGILGGNIAEVNFWRGIKDFETTAKSLMIWLVLWMSTNLSLRGAKFNAGVISRASQT